MNIIFLDKQGHCCSEMEADFSCEISEALNGLSGFLIVRIVSNNEDVQINHNYIHGGILVLQPQQEKRPNQEYLSS